MVSDCTGERGFSKLKRIKSESRSTIKQERLNMLSLMSVHNDILRAVNFDDRIHDFASKKARKANFINC